MVRLSAAKIRNGFNHALLVDPELAQLFQPKRVNEFKILDLLEGGDEAVYAVVQDEQLLLPQVRQRARAELPGSFEVVLRVLDG